MYHRFSRRVSRVHFPKLSWPQKHFFSFALSLSFPPKYGWSIFWESWVKVGRGGHRGKRGCPLLHWELSPWLRGKFHFCLPKFSLPGLECARLSYYVRAVWLRIVKWEWKHSSIVDTKLLQRHFLKVFKNYGPRKREFASSFIIQEFNHLHYWNW